MTNATKVREGLKWLLVVVTCPCHVPIWVVLLAGTAVGAWLASNILPAIIVSAGLFAASLFWAGRGLSGGERLSSIVWMEPGEHEVLDQKVKEALR